MKVIHLISGGDVGGAKTHVLTLLQGLNRTEDVHLICFMEGEFAQEARRLQIPTTVLDGVGVKRACKRIHAMIAHGGYELVHCHGSRANMMGALLRFKLDIPVVSTIHSDYKLDYLGRPLAALAYGTINKLALRRLDYWIGVSDSFADMMVSRGFSPQRVFTIYNGVDFQISAPQCSREELLRSAGMEPQEDLVLFGIAARISPVKDMTTLIRAFSAAVAQCPRMRLLIAGDGEQGEEIRALAARTCPEGTVGFLGWTEDTDSFFQAIDVNLLTSLSESFPYVLTEGAARHCATIATNVGGIPKLIDDGVNGLLFPPRDAEMLTRHMLLLAENAALRQQMCELLHEKAKRFFSLDATVERQKEIYATILRRTARFTGRRDGVFICGAYGKNNSGDEAILQAIVAQMQQIDPDIPLYVLSRKPKETRISARIHAMHSFNLPKMLLCMRKTRLYLNGGGSLLQDVTSYRSLLYYLWNIRFAKALGNRVMLYGSGIGPLKRNISRKRAARTLNRCAEVISLRDPDSVNELHALGVERPRIVLAADVALLTSAAAEYEEKSYYLRCGLREDERYLLIAVRPWEGFEKKAAAIAAAADYAARAYRLKPILFAMEPSRDCAAQKMVAERLHCEHLLLSAESGPLTISLLRRAELVISMRLHALIFAAGQGIPVVGLVYDPKVSGFLDYLGQEFYLPLDALNEGNLSDMIDGALSAASAEPATVEQLRALAQKNAALAKELLEESV